MAITVLLSAAHISWAADIYVSQLTSGNGSGSDAANCKSLATVNESWPASAGDTVHLVGTMTDPLICGGGGTAGNLLTIKFESGAKFSAPTVASGSIWISPANYTVIDGGLNGRIELTDNGTPIALGGTCHYTNGSIWGIFSSGSHGLTIKNLTIDALYRRQTTNDAGPILNANGVAGIFTRDCTDLTVSNCVITDVQNAISATYNYSYQSNIVVSRCVLSNYVWGLSVAADSADAFIDNIIVTNSQFFTGDAWEGNSDFHRNGIYLRRDVQAGGRMSNVVFSCNVVRAGTNPRTTDGGTSGLSLSMLDATNMVGLKCYNNVFILTAPLTYSSGGASQIGVGGVNALCANNTIVGWTNGGTGYYGGSGFSIGSMNALAANNIVVSGTGLTITGQTTQSGLPNNAATWDSILWTSNVLSDYNVFNRQGPNSFVGLIGRPEGLMEPIFDNLAAYRASLPHQDTHSTTSIAILDANYVPTSADTVARGNGTNLTSFGITSDFYGNPRPAAGPWTIGAFEYIPPQSIIGTLTVDRLTIAP